MKRKNVCKNYFVNLNWRGFGMKKSLIIISAILFLFSTSSAVTTTFDDDLGDHDWDNLINWDNGFPAGNDAYIGTNIADGKYAQIDATTDFAQLAVNSVVISGYDVTGAKLVMTGNTLTTAGRFSVDAAGLATDSGWFEMTGGTVNVGQLLQIGKNTLGQAVIDISGGTINVSGGLQFYSGELNITDSGTVNVAYIQKANWGSGTLFMDVGGKFTVGGDETLWIGNRLGGNKFVNPYDGTTGTANWKLEYCDVSNTTTLTVVPEPMTMGLLGLGAFFIRKRK